MILALIVGLSILGAFIKPTKTSSELNQNAPASHKHKTAKNHKAPNGRSARRGTRPASKRQQKPSRSHTTRAATPAPKRRPQARVVVGQIGFSQSSTYGIDYGLTLVNESTVADAVDLKVTVRARDALGRSSASDTNWISVIPANTSFNLAGGMTPQVSLKATKLGVTIRVGQSRPTSPLRRLPLVTNVRVNESDTFADVFATLTNPSSKPLSQYAPIYVLYLNSRGQIITSSEDTTGAAVQPHQTVRVHVLEDYDISKRPVTARVSVDPCTSLDVLC